VVAALLSRGLVEERIVEDTAEADPALNTLWRNPDDGRGILLRITAGGLASVGIEADGAPVATIEAGTDAGPNDGSTTAVSAGQAAPTARSGETREGTKQALLIASWSARKGRPSSRSWRRPAGSRIPLEAPSPERSRSGSALLSPRRRWKAAGASTGLQADRRCRAPLLLGPRGPRPNLRGARRLAVTRLGRRPMAT
jgi:hypothetical protein